MEKIPGIRHGDAETLPTITTTNILPQKVIDIARQRNIEILALDYRIGDDKYPARWALKPGEVLKFIDLLLCRECHDGVPMRHEASASCKSGGRNHCTCDTCF